LTEAIEIRRRSGLMSASGWMEGAHGAKKKKSESNKMGYRGSMEFHVDYRDIDETAQEWRKGDYTSAKKSVFGSVKYQLRLV